MNQLNKPYPPPQPPKPRLKYLIWLLIFSLVFPSLSPVLTVRADTPIAYEYDDSDQLDNASNDFTHNANGSITDDGQTDYVYDAANRLSHTVQSGITTTYKYDAWGNMVQQVVDDGATTTTTDFMLDELAPHTRILGEITGSDEIKYAYGPEGLAAQKDSSGSVHYALLDHLGSVRHLSDASGNLTRSFYYNAYGSIRHQSGSTVMPMRFTGERQGPDDTIYLRARHYLPARSDDQTVGRFLQRDSVDDPNNQHNRYAYVGNNPVNRVDPSGHCPHCIAIGIGAGVGAAVDYGVQVYGNRKQGRSWGDSLINIDGRRLGSSALGGAVSGALGGAFGPISGPISRILGPAGGAVVQGGIIGAAEGIIQVPIDVLLGVCGATDNMLERTLMSTLAGGLSGGLASVNNLPRIWRPTRKNPIPPGFTPKIGPHLGKNPILISGHGSQPVGLGGKVPTFKVPEGVRICYFAPTGCMLSGDIPNSIAKGNGGRLKNPGIIYGPGKDVPNTTIYPDPKSPNGSGILKVDKPTSLSEIVKNIEGKGQTLCVGSCQVLDGQRINNTPSIELTGSRPNPSQNRYPY